MKSVLLLLLVVIFVFKSRVICECNLAEGERCSSRNAGTGNTGDIHRLQALHVTKLLGDYVSKKKKEKQKYQNRYVFFLFPSSFP